MKNCYKRTSSFQLKFSLKLSTFPPIFSFKIVLYSEDYVQLWKDEENIRI